jgi:hypothetical protein
MKNQSLQYKDCTFYYCSEQNIKIKNNKKEDVLQKHVNVYILY